jgi:RNA polymerase sigma-70 factor (ECF subfamily)
MMCTLFENDPDIALMLRVKDGDESAFEELEAKYRQPLMRFYYSLCWNAEAAKDYAQEVLVRLWLARNRYEPTGRFTVYLFKIARNYWFMVLRARKCRPEPLSLEESWEPSPDETGLERLLIRRYMDRRIRQAVAELPEHYHMVFVLNHFQDMKYAEIAEVLEIPVGTVKSRMSAAVRILRDKLSNEMRDE